MCPVLSNVSFIRKMMMFAYSFKHAGFCIQSQWKRYIGLNVSGKKLYTCAKTISYAKLSLAVSYRCCCASTGVWWRMASNLLFARLLIAASYYLASYWFHGMSACDHDSRSNKSCINIFDPLWPNMAWWCPWVRFVTLKFVVVISH